jgi:hypothetical protein
MQPLSRPRLPSCRQPVFGHPSRIGTSAADAARPHTTRCTLSGVTIRGRSDRIGSMEAGQCVLVLLEPEPIITTREPDGEIRRILLEESRQVCPASSHYPRREYVAARAVAMVA